MSGQELLFVAINNRSHGCQEAGGPLVGAIANRESGIEKSYRDWQSLPHLEGELL